MKTVDEMLQCARQYYPSGVDTEKYHREPFDNIARALNPDEEVLFAFMGLYGKRAGESKLGNVGVALTNDRLLICGARQGFIKVTQELRAYSLDDITNFSVENAAIGGAVVIHMNGGELRVTSLLRDWLTDIVNGSFEALAAARSGKNKTVL